MRIVHALAYYGDYLGGIQIYVRELAKRQKAEGHKVKIITSDLYGSQKKIDGIKVIRCKSWFSAFRVPFTPSLPFKLLKEDCDVLHVHLPLPWLDICSVLKKLVHKKTKLVLTIHNDLQINSVCSNIFGWVHNKFLIGNVIKKSDSIITTTKAFANSLVYKIPKEKQKIIPLGIDTKKFKPNKKIKKNQILFVGRLIPEKGLHLLMLAMKKVRKEFPNLKLIVAYQPVYNYPDYYREIKSLDDGFLVEKKDCSQKELISLYSESKCFVLPTLQESFGLVLLESMACQTPVICFNLPGPASFINKKNGILIERGNTTKLAEAIIKILNDTKRYQKNLRDYVKKEFNWDKINKQILGVYKK